LGFYRRALDFSIGSALSRTGKTTFGWACPHWLRTSQARSASAAAGAHCAAAVRAGLAGNSPGEAASRRRDIPEPG